MLQYTRLFQKATYNYEKNFVLEKSCCYDVHKESKAGGIYMNVHNELPIMALTMGDPSGIGPEICVGCFGDEELYEKSRPMLIGDKHEMEKAISLLNSNLELNLIENPEDARFEFGKVDLIQTDHGQSEEIVYGKPTKAGSVMANSFILKAIQLGKAKLVDGIATSPISKEEFTNAGYTETNHTAIFAREVTGYTTISMFHCNEMKVFHYTRHMSLLNAIKALDTEKITETFVKVHNAMQRVGFDNPRIAVAALNPHASDNGMFGLEEKEIIEPAVEKAKEQGINAFGPIPADSVFYQHRNGSYDAVLSLFHDQGHIACKTYDFENSVSLTLGYPFVRTTVDHGTAYGIAGKGIASYGNLKAATLVGAEYAKYF